MTICDDGSLNLWRLDVKDERSQLSLIKTISADNRSVCRIKLEFHGTDTDIRDAPIV